MEVSMRHTHMHRQHDAHTAVSHFLPFMHHVHMNELQALGQIIKQRRNAAGLNQPQLGEAAGIDQGGISRIENGRQAPSYETLVRIARALGTRPGIIQMEADGLVHRDEGEPTAYQLTQALGVKHVPLISWVQAGNFEEAVDSYARGTGQQMIQTTARVGRLAYALAVKGNSMVNPRDDRRTFPEGSIIIVDPARPLENGALIIARLENEAETTFKQYVTDAGREMLVPLNPQFPTIELSKPMIFCGVVVSKAEQSLDT